MSTQQYLLLVRPVLVHDVGVVNVVVAVVVVVVVAYQIASAAGTLRARHDSQLRQQQHDNTINRQGLSNGVAKIQVLIHSFNLRTMHQ